MTAFFRIHSDLDREGPGDRASLDWALGHAKPPRDARMLDAGCGPGADIEGLLAHAPEGSVLALDKHAPFVEAAARRFRDEARVRVETGDMARPDGVFDLIWCAGALYFHGVREGLTGWRPHLKPGGRVAFSEIVWCTDAPAREAREFWRAYPAMTDTAGVLGHVEAARYRVIASRLLPENAWREYYDPLALRMEILRDFGPGAELTRALEGEQAELDLWRDHGRDYGYLQVICEPG